MDTEQHQLIWKYDILITWTQAEKFTRKTIPANHLLPNWTYTMTAWYKMVMIWLCDILPTGEGIKEKRECSPIFVSLQAFNRSKNSWLCSFLPSVISCAWRGTAAADGRLWPSLQTSYYCTATHCLFTKKGWI